MCAQAIYRQCPAWVESFYRPRAKSIVLLSARLGKNETLKGTVMASLDAIKAYRFCIQIGQFSISSASTVNARRSSEVATQAKTEGPPINPHVAFTLDALSEMEIDSLLSASDRSLRVFSIRSIEVRRIVYESRLDFCGSIKTSSDRDAAHTTLGDRVRREWSGGRSQVYYTDDKSINTVQYILIGGQCAYIRTLK